MHESWLNAQETGRDVQRVVENIFLIKILGTSNEEIKRYDLTTKKLQDSQLKNQIFGTTEFFDAKLYNCIHNFYIIYIYKFNKNYHVRVSWRDIKTCSNTRIFKHFIKHDDKTLKSI